MWHCVVGKQKQWEVIWNLAGGQQKGWTMGHFTAAAAAAAAEHSNIEREGEKKRRRRRGGKTRKRETEPEPELVGFLCSRGACLWRLCSGLQVWPQAPALSLGITNRQMCNLPQRCGREPEGAQSSCLLTGCMQESLPWQLSFIHCVAPWNNKTVHRLADFFFFFFFYSFCVAWICSCCWWVKLSHAKWSRTDTTFLLA